MISYILKRIPIAIFTMLSVSFVAFITMQAPAGDYVDYLTRHCGGQASFAGSQGSHGNISCSADIPTPEAQALLREELGLAKPMIVRYFDWIYSIIFKFDLGYSLRPGGVFENAGDMILEHLPGTIYLTLFTLLITWTLAIPIGIYSAVRQHTIGDYIFTFLGFTGIAVPDFLLALVVMYLLYTHFDYSVGTLHSGEYEFAPWSFGKVIDMLEHLLVPALVLGTSGTAALIRVMRNNLLDELNKPYVVTGLSKGVSTWKVVLKYPVRVAINPYVSSIGFIIPALISGSVILSVVMGLPTLGLLLLGAIDGQDVWLAGDIILILGIMTVVGTLISDLLLIVVDPRIRMT